MKFTASLRVATLILAGGLALSGCGGSSENPRALVLQQLHSVDVLSEQDFAVPMDGGITALMPVFASRKLIEPQAGVKRAVIGIQDSARNANVVFEALKDALGAAAGAQGDALVVVPQFLAQQDIDKHKLGPDYARWTVDNWRTGGGSRPVSLQDAGVPLSSFSALDAVLLFLSDRSFYPDLEEIVIVGHDSGARMVQLYAAVTKGLGAPRALGVRVRFLAASADSYLYFDDKRPVRGEKDFAPIERDVCAGYQLWPYGTVLMPAYATGRPARDIAADYAKAQVTLILGDRESTGSDRGCEAMAQGRNRVERLENYQRYLAQYLGKPPETHQTVIAKGVDGSLKSLFNSACLRSLIAGASGC